MCSREEYSLSPQASSMIFKNTLSSTKLLNIIEKVKNSYGRILTRRIRRARSLNTYNNWSTRLVK